MKKVLVTGAGGFIGHHLTRLLLQRGVETVCFLRYTSGSSPGLLSTLPEHLVGGLNTVYGDIRDSDAVRRAAAGCDTLFHLAAHIGIPFSYISPRDVISVNVGGTLNILETARETGARVVVTSSSEVYGTALETPITESHRLHAQSPYAASKTAGDQLALSYHCAFGLPVTICRPFNTYGPGQSQRAVIPTIINQAMKSSRIELGSTEPTRDLLFVEDTVRGFAALAECPAAAGEAVQLGTGTEISIGDLARLVLRILNREDMEVRCSPERTRPDRSEVMRLVASPALAEKLTGWKPEVPLEEGLRITAEWIRRHPELYPLRGYEV